MLELASSRTVVEPPQAPRVLTPQLEIPGYDFEAARALERELGVSHVLGQVLVRRGFADPAVARAFLAAEEGYEPDAFLGIGDAVAVIERHIRAGSRITVHGDYDVDGVCATAILVRALRVLGASVDWFLPSRIDDGYGLAMATVERLAARGTGLLITVDCAITAVEEVARARAAGIDVVVTDHHSPRADGVLPEAPIVHPGVCGYPCRELCGTAVAFKLAQALGAPTAAADIELVALATVADVVPLRGENRRLVREGLRAMANTAKPGLRALMAVARVDPGELDASALGFRLAPRINAAGRIRRADAGLELLLTEDAARAEQVAAELAGANAERQAVEQRILWEAEALVAELGERSAYVLAAEGWHPGVIGIVASRVAERRHRPAILIALDGDIGTGSGRSIPGFDLLGALHAAAAELIRYGGHRAAAGLTIDRERVDAFRELVEEHATATLTPEQLVPVERVDAVASGAQLGLALAEELELLEPCGMGNPGARLLVPGGRFDDVRAMGEGKHARFSVRTGGGRAGAVAFGCGGALPVPCGVPVDATFRLERNAWRGAVAPRLVLRQAQASIGHAQPIEILGEPPDYVPAALEEVDALVADIARATSDGPAQAQPRRVVLDRCGESPLAVLADALAGGGPMLAVCADVSRRIEGLSTRTGGFALCSYHALEREPALADRFAHLVALDPPVAASAHGALRARPGAAERGYVHLSWGEAELRFAEQMHELEYRLRASLVTLYRGLRQLGRAAGEELERLLRGDGPHGRPARLAGRLIRVLAELELVSLDRDLPALAIAGTSPTALERSPAFRVYSQRYEDGRRYLSSEKARRSA
ncbi:MAG: single-stranded-DNA-specific exonuclease RecJ [Actinomycetota bacterium]|nr:single-stranded-DNA-specific exonuclease RecJ [Actinomycetota bacterium]